MNNNKLMLMIAIAYLIGFIGIGSLIASWGIRERMIEFKHWKETYESGYCPTCGHKLDD